MVGTPSRMLTLLSLLQARRDWPGAVLAERLGVSVRTLRRDVERLRELGYRITAVKGPDGGYRLDAGADLPPLLFDDEQAVALALALQTASVTGVAEPEAALRALTTVRQVLPAKLRHRVDELAVSLAPDPRSVPVDPAVLLAVSAAARSRVVLRFDHLAVDADPDAEPMRRRVEPHEVAFVAGRWYLVAWDIERDDWRVFRVDRMTPRTPTGARFALRELPDGDVGAFVAARLSGADHGARPPCVGSVIVARSARQLAPFARDARLDDLGDGRCRVELGAWSWGALAAGFARFDAELADPRPRELADAFAHLSRRFAAVVA